MWSDTMDLNDARMAERVKRLENFHRSKLGWVSGLLLLGLVAFVAWAMHFRIDEVARAHGEVIASSRVQVIQAVDGGVLSQLQVREGDRVNAGDVLARLDLTRISAVVGETEARLFALQAKAARLRAEVTGSAQPKFPQAPAAGLQEQVTVEQALFTQRKQGLSEELRTLQVALDLARKKLDLVEALKAGGDASGSEVLAARNASNDAEARLIARENKFFEEARSDLTRTEGEMAQLAQTLTRHQQERKDTVFTANMPGIVKNIRMTTVGGVLRAGDEMMQIVPVEDDLIIEAKVSPADIARVRTGLQANLRLDPFDYTIFGSVPGEVVYVSADTLKERTGRGDEIYYRVHVKPVGNPVVTNVGKTVEMVPGMTAQVDIRTGDRTVIDYLLKPLRKTLMESLGER